MKQRIGDYGIESLVDVVDVPQGSVLLLIVKENVPSVELEHIRAYVKDVLGDSMKVIMLNSTKLDVTVLRPL